MTTEANARERRPHRVLRRGAERDARGHATQRVSWIVCPFCQAEVKAYDWSLAGSGKRCACGAVLYADVAETRP